MEPIALAVVGALAVGLSLGVFGSGGSILTVPVLVLLLHHEEKVAIAESLGIVGSIALIGAIPHIRRRAVDWRTAALFAGPGILGTLAGSWVASGVPAFVQMIVFGVAMAAAAIAMWRRSAPGSGAADAESPRRAHPAQAATQGLGVGVLTGFVGVGGGFLIVPALVALAGLAMKRAVATSLVVIVVNCAAGLVKHQSTLAEASLDWAVMAVFVVVGGVGSLGGSVVQGRVNQRALKRGFAVFLLLMSSLILVREIVGLGGEGGSAPVASERPLQ